MARSMELQEPEAGDIKSLSSVIQEGETVFLEQNGQPVAVLIPIEEYRSLQSSAPTNTPAASVTDNGLERDRAAFAQAREELRRTHRKGFVGIKDGELVDSGKDEAELIERMYDRFGYVPIYVRSIDEPERVCRVPGPRRLR